MRNRSLRWALLVSLLIALGVGIYRVQEPEPTCTIEGEWSPLCFADEGRRLVVILPPEASRPQDGSLLVLDTRTGAEIARHLKKDQGPSFTACSLDGRLVAAEIHHGLVKAGVRPKGSELFLIDTLTNEVRELPLGKAAWPPTMFFSPKGDLLFRNHPEDRIGLRIWDTTDGRMVDQRRAGDEMKLVGDALVHQVTTVDEPHDLEIWSLKERKSIATLPKAGRFVGLSGDGRFCVCLPDRNWPPWCIWNVKTSRIEKKVGSLIHLNARIS